MSIAETLLPEFDQEMSRTRRMLERVPDGDLMWRPHERSMPIGRLATHLAELPGEAASACEMDELDMAPDGAETFVPTILQSQQEWLALFDENVTRARAAIARTDDATMQRPWTLKVGGEAVFTLPKVAFIRTWVMNHSIHHRGQLSVFLRLRGQPVPAIYGPSADEQPT